MPNDRETIELPGGWWFSKPFPANAPLRRYWRSLYGPDGKWRANFFEEDVESFAAAFTAQPTPVAGYQPSRKACELAEGGVGLDEIERLKGDLPDDIRVPLHEVWADIAYLLGRAAAEGHSVVTPFADGVRKKLASAELAIRTALARPVSPQDAGVVRDRVLEDDLEKLLVLSQQVALLCGANRWGKLGQDFDEAKARFVTALRTTPPSDQPEKAETSSKRGPTVPAQNGEAQNGLNDVALSDPYPVAAILKGIRRRSIQALHAGLSRRDWHATETAANEARDAIDRLLIRMGERP